MKNRFWKTFFIVVSIVILFALIGLTNGKNRNVTIAENLISDIFTFPQISGYKEREKYHNPGCG